MRAGRTDTNAFIDTARRGRRWWWPVALVALALVLAACGDGETAADDTAGEAIVEDAVGETEPVEGSDEGDEPDDTGSEETAAEGAEPDDGGGSEDAAAVDSGELSVEIDCPPTIVLNEQMLCDIISTGAVSGEWRLPGFTEEPIEMETVPGNNGIFVEPTNPAFVGAWFTLTAEVTSADGETAIDQHRFTIESSAANATLIDDLNTVTTSTPINFASGSAQIESGDVPALDRVVALLVAAPDATIEVGGHTDDDGDDAANQALSEARAQAVVDYFVASGVNPQQVQAAGYGETQPIADNATAEGKAANRRIEFRESGGSPFITIDCPVEFVLGVETRCDIVTANATDGGWRIDGFTDGDVGLATIPGTNEIFIQPTNPAAVGGTFVIEVTVTDAAGQVARQDHTFTIVAE